MGRFEEVLEEQLHSGLALRHGVTALNAPGLVDAGDRGGVKVLPIKHDRGLPVRIVLIATLALITVASAGSGMGP